MSPASSRPRRLHETARGEREEDRRGRRHAGEVTRPAPDSEVADGARLPFAGRPAATRATDRSLAEPPQCLGISRELFVEDPVEQLGSAMGRYTLESPAARPPAWIVPPTRLDAAEHRFRRR